MITICIVLLTSYFCIAHYVHTCVHMAGDVRIIHGAAAAGRRGGVGGGSARRENPQAGEEHERLRDLRPVSDHG